MDNAPLDIPVGRYSLRAITQWKMPEDYPNDTDWALAREIEDNVSSAFYGCNQLLSGEPIVLPFASRYAASLFRARLVYLLHQHADHHLREELKHFDIFMSVRVSTGNKDSRDHYKGVQEKAERIVRLSAEHCARVFKEMLPLPSDWNAKITCDWSPMRRSSWGGYNAEGDQVRYGKYGGISLAMRTIVNREGEAVNNRLVEHKTLDNDSDMGGFKTDHWGLQLMALTCNETSHAAQMYYFIEIKNDPRYKSSYGKGFQHLYRHARRQVCNPRLMKAGVVIGS